MYLDGEVPKKMLADMVKASQKTLLSGLGKKAQREILEE